jgi:Fur family transcriptional regulator, peroxide stress response regulator
MKPRATRQLSAVYDVLATSHDHPTADQIFQRVRHVMPRVSLGTVYRNLDKLREQGHLRVVRLEGGQAHYDAVIDAHDHFVCERCGAVLDLPSATVPPAVERLRATGCVVHWQTTSVYGLCGACAAAPAATGESAR